MSFTFGSTGRKSDEDDDDDGAPPPPNAVAATLKPHTRLCATEEKGFEDESCRRRRPLVVVCVFPSVCFIHVPLPRSS